MIKRTFSFPWVGAIFLLLAVASLSNSGSAFAQDPSTHQNDISLNPLLALLSDKVESGALGAQVGESLLYTTVLSVAPLLSDEVPAQPVRDIAYQLDVDPALSLSAEYDTTPIAYDDAYELAVGRLIEVSAQDGLLAAGSQLPSTTKITLAPDQDFDLSPTVFVLAETVTTEKATVLIRPDGSFIYELLDSIVIDANSNFFDQFSYTIVDDEGNQDVASVSLHFKPQRIFYVNNQVEVSGSGSLDSPFGQLDEALSAADSECDVIFLFASPDPYDIDHVELLNCQKLVGQDYAPYSMIGLTGLGTAPHPTTANRPTIRCSQAINYLPENNSSLIFSTTNNGCIELAKNNIVAGLNIDNVDAVQKGIAGENFNTFWAFNITALNSDGFSFSCDDSTTHQFNLTESIQIYQYGFVGIDIASFPASQAEDCSLKGSISDVTISDSTSNANEAIYAISQAETSLTLAIDQIQASNISESVIRAAAYESSNLSLEVTNALMSDYDKAGVALENYVFWPSAALGRGLFASVSDSKMVPNDNGRGISVNSQGNVSSDLRFENNEIGQVGIQSDGIAIYGNNDGALNAAIIDNLFLSRGAPNPDLPIEQTHAPHMPIYFESNMDNAIGCLEIKGNKAPAGFNYIYNLETASLGIRAGDNGEVRLHGWDGQDDRPGAAAYIQSDNPGLDGGAQVILNPGGVLSAGACPEISALSEAVSGINSNFDSPATDTDQPVINIPVLPPEKTVTIHMSAVVNELAIELDRVSAQGMYTVGNLGQTYKTIDPAPVVDFEDSENRTVTPIEEMIFPDLIVADLVVAEDIGLATLTLELSEVSNRDIQVEYSMASGTATSGLDYIETDGVILFPIGTLSQTLQIEIVDDTLAEDDESFSIDFAIGSGSSLLIPDPQIALTISANDTVTVVPTLVAGSDMVVSESAETISVTLELDQAVSQDVLVLYTFSAGTAASGSDFVNLPGELRFVAGQTSATFTVEIVDNLTFELDEVFSINLAAKPGSNILIPDPTIAITVKDDDEPPVPKLSAADVVVNEAAGVATVQISLDIASTQDIVINYQTFVGTALYPEDFSAVNSTISIPAGAQSVSLSIPIVDDALNELNEYFFVQLTAANPGAVTIDNPELVVTIVDNDAISIVAGGPAHIIEDEGTVTVDFFLSRPSAVEVRVDVATIGSLVVEPGIDYVALSTTLVFAPGQTQLSVNVSIIDDVDVAPLYEGVERLQLQLSNPQNALIYGSGTADIFIINNDRPIPYVYFEFADYSIYENMDSDPSTPTELEVTVKLSNAVATDISVTVESIDNGDSASPLDDYEPVNTIVTFPAGTREATFSVTITTDNIVERPETFVLRFFQTSGPVAIDPIQNSATVTIVDGTAPTLRVSETSTVETWSGTSWAVFELTVEGNAVQPIRLGIQTSLDTSSRSAAADLIDVSSRRAPHWIKLNPGTTKYQFAVPINEIAGAEEGLEGEANLRLLTEIVGIGGAQSESVYHVTLQNGQPRSYSLYLPIVVSE